MYVTCNHAYCIKCGAECDYSVVTKDVTLKNGDVEFTYQEDDAVCKQCGESVYVPSVNDENARRREKAYHEAVEKLNDFKNWAEVKVNILGSEWTIEGHAEKDDSRLNNCSGYTDFTSKLIVVEIEPETNLDEILVMQKKVARHEIVHAFLFESGLDVNTFSAETWATNEEMVDWIAMQGPKIYEAWREAKAL